MALMLFNAVVGTLCFTPTPDDNVNATATEVRRKSLFTTANAYEVEGRKIR